MIAKTVSIHVKLVYFVFKMPLSLIKVIKQTHAPLMWVPRVEPASESQRFVSLFDENDGRVKVATCWVSPQVILRAVPRLLGLALVG